MSYDITRGRELAASGKYAPHNGADEVPLPPEPPLDDERGSSIREVTHSWTPVDPSNVLDGTWRPPEPTVGRRSDGVGLFYPAKQHTVASESEGGKTWFLMAAARDEIHRDQHVLYYDFEDDIGPVVGRMLALGANPERIREYFHYIRPESPVGAPTNLIDLDGTLARFAPSLAVVDGVTEAMVLHGLNPLDNADAATFGRMVPRRLAQAGAAVVSLDHVPKATESRGRYSIGAVHKLNGLDGAAYVLDNRRPFGIGVEGVSTIRIAKDRPGQLRKHALPGGGGLYWFADLVLDGTVADGHTEVAVLAPVDHSRTDAPPTHMMKRVSDELANHPQGLAQRVVCDIVSGKTDTIRRALSHLIAGGYVSDKTPHRLLKPFSDDGEGE